MNKADAKKFAQRLVAGFIWELFQADKSDPLVYDEYFQDWSGIKGAPDFAGRRLSKADRERVEKAMDNIYTELDDKGWADYHKYLESDYREQCAHRWPKPSGKPGNRWSQYKGWLKRQGRIE
jgi:hypothetical protein